MAEELAAELRERERAAQEELREKEKTERELARKLKEEEKRREEQWERHIAQLKKRASTIDSKVLDTWTIYSYVQRFVCKLYVITHRLKLAQNFLLNKLQ